MRDRVSCTMAATARCAVLCQVRAGFGHAAGASDGADAAIDASNTPETIASNSESTHSGSEQRMSANTSAVRQLATITDTALTS